LLLEKSTPDPGIQQTVLLGVAEVARRLAVSTATVYALCRSGQLRHARVLNTIRVRPEDLASFVEEASTR
jgi:excisionase family DNA binding protein